MNTLIAWQIFNYGINQRSLYILGAGASMPDISFDNSSVVNKIITLDGYDVIHQPKTLIRTRLSSTNDYFNAQDHLNQQLIDHTLEPIIHGIFAQNLTIEFCQFPPQYKVFDLFNASIIFNYNVDNLAEGLHYRHINIYPHGYVHTKFAHSKIVNEIIQSNMNVPMSKLNTFYLPLPEPADFTLGEPYQKLSKVFHSLTVVILIGYSFGLQNVSGEIDDIESFEFLMSLLRKFPKPVLVIDPNPQLLIDRIEYSIKRNCLFFLPYKWNVLSSFILSGNFSKHLSTNLQKIDYNYLKYSEAYEANTYNNK